MGPTCRFFEAELSWGSPDSQGLARNEDGEVVVSWLVLNRSGSLDFPAPSLTLRVAARVFEVFRLCHAGSAPSCEVSDSVRTLGSWLPFRACCLSSGSDRSDLPSLGFVFFPLHRPCRASTPACVAARFGHEDPAS